MKSNMKIINRIIFITIILLFSWIFISSLFLNSNVFYNENSIISLIICIPISILFLLIYYFIKKSKITLSIKKEIVLLILYFIIVTIIQLIVLNQLDVIPGWDFGVIYDNALKYAETGSRANAVYSEYFQYFPNNILMLLMLVITIKVGLTIGISAITSIHILNILFIDLSLLLIYLTIRKIFGKKEAIFSLIITFFFQALFIYTPIVYSDTLSLFIGILFIYLFTFINQKSMKKNILIYIFIGLLAFIGKSIKVTSLIVLIALIFNYLLKNKLKNTIIAVLIIGVSFISFNTIFKLVVSEEKHFKANDYGSYPYTHWLMMGVEDIDQDNSGRNTYGGYNAADYDKTRSFKTGKEAQKYNIQEYVKRVKKMKASGYIKFLTKKNVNIWTDGYYFSNVAIGINPVNDSPLRKWIRNEDTRYYGIYFNQAVVYTFILMLIIGSILKLKETKYKEIDYIRLSIIGILIFLSFWEGRSRYLVNFIPLFIIIIIEFSSIIYNKYLKELKK